MEASCLCDDESESLTESWIRFAIIDWLWWVGGDGGRSGVGGISMVWDDVLTLECFCIKEA